MHRVNVSISSGRHHRRLPSLESTSSGGGRDEKPAHYPHTQHQAFEFEQISLQPTPVSILKKKRPEEVLPPPAAPGPFANKGKDFWLVFLALCVSSFLAAIDLTGVSTVLVTSESVARLDV